MVPSCVKYSKNLLLCRKKIEAIAAHHNTSTPMSLSKGTSVIKKKRAVVPKKQANVNHPVSIVI